MNVITKDQLADRDNPGDGWFQIEASGVHPQSTESGETINQIIDNATVAAIVKNGCPAEGILVDCDHLSREDDHTTQAYGWVRDLAALADADGNYQLCANIEWTTIGLPLIQGKVYKHFSTEYVVAAADKASGELRPDLLVGLALTNRPNNEGQMPITNRKPETTCNNQNQTSQNNMEELNQIAEALGMAEGSSVEDIITEIKTLQAAEETAAEAEADAILENNEEALSELSEEEKELIKEELMTNRDKGKKMIDMIVKNRKPSNAPAKYAGKKGAQAKENRLPGKSKPGEDTSIMKNRIARTYEIMKNRSLSYNKAYALAKAEENR